MARGFRGKEFKRKDYDYGQRTYDGRTEDGRQVMTKAHMTFPYILYFISASNYYIFSATTLFLHRTPPPLF